MSETPKQQFKVIRGGEVLRTGNADQIREEVEGLLESKLGFFTMLQENIENGIYYIYYHSDNDEDRTDAEQKTLKKFGIGVNDPLKSNREILNLLDISIETIK